MGFWGHEAIRPVRQVVSKAFWNASEMGRNPSCVPKFCAQAGPVASFPQTTGAMLLVGKSETMSVDVTNRLRGLGLEKYAAAFHDNAVDIGALQELKPDDLKDLGVNRVEKCWGSCFSMRLMIVILLCEFAFSTYPARAVQIP